MNGVVTVDEARLDHKSQGRDKGRQEIERAQLRNITFRGDILPRCPRRVEGAAQARGRSDMRRHSMIRHMTEHFLPETRPVEASSESGHTQMPSTDVCAHLWIAVRAKEHTVLK